MKLLPTSEKITLKRPVLMVFATSISQSLVDIVGPLHLLTDNDSLQRFGVDRTTLWRPNPSAVVLPASVEEVQKIVRLAN